MISSKNISVSNLVAIVLVVITTILLSTVGMLGYQWYANQKWNEIHAHHRLLVEQASNGLALPMWNFDKEQLDRVMESMMGDKEVIAIVIRQSNSNQIIEAFRRNSQGKLVRTEKEINTLDLYSITQPIRFSNLIIGSVEVYTTPQFLVVHLKKTRWVIIISILTINLLLTLCLYLLLNHIIIKPIKILEQFALNLPKDYTPFASIHVYPFYGELHNLWNSFTNMIQLLDNRYKDLQHETKQNHETELKFYALLRSIPDLVWVKNLQGAYISCNPEFERFLGVTEAEIIGKTDFDIAVHNQAKSFMASDQEVIISGNPSINEVWVAFADNGKNTLLECEKVPIRDIDENLIGILGIARDITERNHAKEELKKSEERLRTLINTIPDLIWIKNQEGIYLQCNQRFESFFGASEKDILGKTDYDFVNIELANSFRNHDIIAMKNGTPTMNEEFVSFPDGHQEYIETLQTPIYEKDGTLFGILGIGRDISARKHAEERLIENRRFLATLISNLAGMVYRCQNDEKWTMEFVSRGSFKLTGYTPNQLIESKSISYGELIHIEDQNNVRDVKQVAIKNRQTFALEYRITDKNKKMKWVWEQGSGLFSELGELIALEGIITDITERKQAEEALRESEMKYSRIVNTANEGILMVGAHTKINYVNAQMCEMLGYQPEEILGNTIEKFIFQTDLPDHFKKVANRISGISEKYERRFIKKDGSLLWILISATSIVDPENNSIGSFAMLTDITERKAAEQAVMESEQRFKTIFDQAPIAITLLDMEGHPILSNRTLSKMVGYSKNELSKMKFIDFTFPADIDIDWNKFNQLLQGEISMYSMEKRYIHKNGNLVWANLYVTVIRDEQGNPQEIIGMAADVTDWKQTETALRESEERYRVINTLSGHMVYEYSISEDVIIWGGAIENVTGYTSEEYKVINLQKWEEFIHPDDRESTIANFKESLKSFKPFKAEYRYQNKKKEYIWITDESYILRNKESKAFKVVGVMKDITQQKKLEGQILSSVIETEEKERSYFSQELHDGIGPLLSATKMYAQWLAMPTVHIERTEILNDIISLLDESSRTVRDISFKLSPHILQNYGIVEAIKAYTRKIKESSPIQIDLDTRNLCRFDENAETVVYRVLCECINNTIKHAEASKIEIRMRCHNNLLKTEFLDDGKGFDLNHVMSVHKGIGILNMQSRLKSINGQLSINSVPEKGTTIKFQIHLVQNGMQNSSFT